MTTLGVVTSVQSISSDKIYATNIEATTLKGDGSQVTGVIAEGSIGLALNNVYVGAGFTEINEIFLGEIEASFASVGNTGTYTITGLAATTNTRSDQLIVTGISTLGIITGSPSAEISFVYGTVEKSDTIKVYDEVSSSVNHSVIFSVDGNPGSDDYESVKHGSLAWTPSNNSLSGISSLSVENVVSTGIITATSFSGDGSGLTGIVGSGSGVIIEDDGSPVGTAGTINFSTNLSVSPVSAGIVTVTSTTPDDISADSLVVTGTSTLGIVTGATYYGDGSALTGISGGIGTNGSVNTTGIITANSFYGDGSNLTGVGGGSTANVSTNTLNVVGVTTLGGDLTVSGDLTVGAAGTINGDASYVVSGKWNLGADGTNNYEFTGIGFTLTTNDPDLYLARGAVYEFVNEMGAHPFRIQSTQNGATGTPYNTGVTNNDVSNGTLRFEIPFSAPDTLYYQCTSHAGMGGTIFIYPTLR